MTNWCIGTRLLLAMAITLGGVSCGPSGGGTVHSVPEGVVGEPTVLELRVSVWGGSRDARGRFTQVLCHYRLAGTTDFAATELKFARQEPEGAVILVCDLPALDSPGAWEYYLSYSFDGYPNRRPAEGVHTVNVVARSPTSGAE